MLAPLRPTWRPLLAVLVGMAAILGATAVYGRANAIPLRDFTGDPVSVLGGRLSDGYLSTIGVLLSWGSAIVSAVTGYALVRSGDRRAASPLLYLTALFAVFSLDDVYQLHEMAVPKVGLPELILPVVYVVAGAVFARIHRDFVRGSEWPLAVLALALLATSLILDTAELGWYFVEDSFKLLGIAVAALYVVRECLARLPFDRRG